MFLHLFNPFYLFYCAFLLANFFWQFLLAISFGNFFWQFLLAVSFGCFFWLFLLAVSVKKTCFFRFLPPQYFADFQALFAKFGTFWAFLLWLFLFYSKAFLLRRTVALTNTHPLLSLLCGGFGGEFA